jgi:hypothetical protein
MKDEVEKTDDCVRKSAASELTPRGRMRNEGVEASEG